MGVGSMVGLRVLDEISVLLEVCPSSVDESIADVVAKSVEDAELSKG